MPHNILLFNFLINKLKTMKNKTSILVGTRHFFYALFAIVILQSCQSKTSTPNGQDGEKVTTGSLTYYSVSAVDYYSNGMHYKVFNSASGSLFVVNITKDSIEYHNNR